MSDHTNAETPTRNVIVSELITLDGVVEALLGSGKRLFEDGSDTTTLKFVDSEAFDSGVVVLTDERAEEETYE